MHAQTMTIVGALSGVIGGTVLGYLIGRRFRIVKARKQFWAASGVSLVLGMFVIFIGELIGVDLIAGFGVGLMTGGLNGLRWGMGRLSDAPRPRREPVVPGEIERRGEVVPPGREEPDPQPPGWQPQEREARDEGRTRTPVG